MQQPRKLDRLKEKNFYEILNVEKDSSIVDIKSSYKEIAKIYHPDSNFFSEIIKTALDPEDEEVFKYLTHAYTVLTNEESRKAYDQTLPPELPDWDTESNYREDLFIKEKKPSPSDVRAASGEAFQNQMQRLNALRTGDNTATDPKKPTPFSPRAEPASVSVIRLPLMIFCGLAVTAFILTVIILVRALA